MKPFNKAIATILAIFCAFAYGDAQVQKWANSHNHAGGTEPDAGYAITTDASGNVYATGIKNLGQTTDNAIETIKYNSSGVIQWHTVTNGGFPSPATGDTESGYCISFDGTYVWVSASWYSGATNEDELVLIRYLGTTGAIQTNYPKVWSDNSNAFHPRGTTLYVYNSTNVYIGGRTYNDGTGVWNGIVLKDDVGATGWLWNYQFNGSGNNVSTSLAEATDLRADASNVFVTGFIVVTGQSYDCFTAKLSASTGAASWTATYNGTNSLADQANAIAVDASGNVYVVGFTQTSTQSKNALAVKYNSSGTQQWASTYNNANLDDVYTDCVLGIKCGTYAMLYAGGYTVKATGASADDDYLLASYDVNAGGLSTCWGTNPRLYNDAAGAPEAAGTDRGYGVEYSATTQRVYISGVSDTLIGTTKTINITTIGYNANNGTVVWRKSYDYGSDIIIADDEVFWKYCLFVKYNTAYCTDEIFVTGNSVVSGQSNNFLSIKYGTNSPPCEGPEGGRIMSSMQTGVVSPNPFSNTATLVISDGIIVNNAVLSVYDGTGRLVSTLRNITSNTIVIDKGNKPIGIYFYKLSDNEKILSSGKFVLVD